MLFIIFTSLLIFKPGKYASVASTLSKSYVGLPYVDYIIRIYILKTLQVNLEICSSILIFLIYEYFKAYQKGVFDKFMLKVTDIVTFDFY